MEALRERKDCSARKESSKIIMAYDERKDNEHEVKKIKIKIK